MIMRCSGFHGPYHNGIVDLETPSTNFRTCTSGCVMYWNGVSSGICQLSESTINLQLNASYFRPILPDRDWR